MKKQLASLIKENPEDTVISTSKLWFNIVNTAIVTVYCMIGYTVSKSMSPNIEGLAWLTLVVAGVVTANKFATKFLSYKYSSISNSEPIVESVKAVSKKKIVPNEDN